MSIFFLCYAILFKILLVHCVGTLLVCSSFTNDGSLDKKNLDCFKWNATTMDWDDFDTPVLDNTAGISNFIQSVKIPDVGIWFTSAKPSSGPGDNSYLLVRFFILFSTTFCSNYSKIEPLI